MKLTPSKDTSIEKPSSLTELSAQVRLIWLRLTAVATRLLGAAGNPGVVTVAVLEAADSPTALAETTRNQ